MKKIIMLMILIFSISWGDAIPAALPVFPEAGYSERSSDVFLYINVRAFLDFANKKGIKTGDIPFLFNGSGGDGKQDIFVKLLPEISDMLVIGSSRMFDKGEGFIILINGTKKLADFLTVSGKSVQTVLPGARIYQGTDEKIFYTLSGNTALFGARADLENYLKAKRGGKPAGPPALKSFLAGTKNKTLYFHVAVSEYMKKAMEGAMSKGKSMGGSLDHNVFLKSIMNMRSMEYSATMQEKTLFQWSITAGNPAEGQRLLMVGHFFIVGISFAVPFIEQLSSSISGKPLKAADDSLVRLQEVFGRISSRQDKNSAAFSLQLTEKEILLLAEGMKKTIGANREKMAKEKERRRVIALFDAVKNGNAGLVKKLMASAKDANQRNDQNETLLYHAAKTGNGDIILYLVEKGADVNALSGTERLSPLIAAVTEGRIDAVRLLLGKGALINLPDAQGRSPLHAAAEGNKPDIAKALVDARCDINSVTLKKSTPLHSAAERGYLPMVKLLTEAGALRDVKDDEGKTPGDRARENNREDVLEYFRSIDKNGSGDKDRDKGSGNGVK